MSTSKLYFYAFGGLIFFLVHPFPYVYTSVMGIMVAVRVYDKVVKARKKKRVVSL